MTSFAPAPKWEVDNNPTVTYPVVTSTGIRELTLSEIKELRESINTKPLMVANDFAKMVNELRDLAIIYHNHQSLRERIDGIVHQYLQPASKKEVQESVDTGVYW